MRRKNAVIDSVANQDLLKAFYYKDSAIQASLQAIQESDRIGQDWHKLKYIEAQKLIESKKEVAKQKRLKWLGFGLAGLIAILSASR